MNKNEILNKMLFQNGKDDMINAREMANLFRKKPDQWLNLSSTKKYLKALEKIDGIPVGKSVIIKKENSNKRDIWMHPKVAIEFARWLSLDFRIYLTTQYGSFTNPTDFFKRERREKIEIGQFFWNDDKLIN